MPKHQQKEQEIEYNFTVNGHWMEEIAKKAHDEAKRMLGDDYTLDIVTVHEQGSGLRADCIATALVQWKEV